MAWKIGNWSTESKNIDKANNTVETTKRSKKYENDKIVYSYSWKKGDYNNNNGKKEWWE